jgi:hypothetical protein
MMKPQPMFRFLVTPQRCIAIIRITGEGVGIDDPILDAVRLRAFGGIGQERGHTRDEGE